jgi:hypothetical protein
LILKRGARDFGQPQGPMIVENDGKVFVHV